MSSYRHGLLHSDSIFYLAFVSTCAAMSWWSVPFRFNILRSICFKACSNVKSAVLARTTHRAEADRLPIFNPPCEARRVSAPASSRGLDNAQAPSRGTAPAPSRGLDNAQASSRGTASAQRRRGHDPVLTLEFGCA